MNKDTTRLVQLVHSIRGRRVALVREPQLVLLKNVASIHALALEATRKQAKLIDLIHAKLSDETTGYDPVYEGRSDWKLLPAFDHPDGPFGCIVSGTGLTHKNSALNRQMMHQSPDEKPTDSIRMYQWGVEGGFPEKGSIGIQPEWFYKGNGALLRSHGSTLEMPVYGNDGGEEPEVAGIYIVDDAGNPRRIGFCTANEFSDHVMEKKNYLYLAPSKLRQSAIGPELAIDADFTAFSGTVSVHRNGTTLWSAPVNSGESNMAHSLQNLEYHHFKYAVHRIPLQAHVHYFGADAFSFGQGIILQDGDVMQVEWSGLGRALKNTLKLAGGAEVMLEVQAL